MSDDEGEMICTEDQSQCGGGLMNGKNACSHTATGMAAPGLPVGLAKRSQYVADLLVRVAGSLPGPALGPAVRSPASVFFDLPRSFKLREPGTRGLGSRTTRFLAGEEAA